MVLQSHPILAQSSVPFYKALCDYGWVDSYLKSQILKDKIREVEKAISELKNLRMHAQDFLEILHSSFDKYEKARLDWIKSYLSSSWGSPEALKFFASKAEQKHIPTYVSWSEIDKIMEELSGYGEISEQSRLSKLEKLDQKLTGLQADLTRLSPQVYFMRNDAKIVCDIREEFVGFWWDLQASLTAPAGPRGVELDASTPEEQNTWRLLGLKKAVDPKARYSPAEDD